MINILDVLVPYQVEPVTKLLNYDGYSLEFDNIEEIITLLECYFLDGELSPNIIDNRYSKLQFDTKYQSYNFAWWQEFDDYHFKQSMLDSVSNTNYVNFFKEYWKDSKNYSLKDIIPVNLYNEFVNIVTERNLILREPTIKFYVSLLLSGITNITVRKQQNMF